MSDGLLRNKRIIKSAIGAYKARDPSLFAPEGLFSLTLRWNKKRSKKNTDDESGPSVVFIVVGIDPVEGLVLFGRRRVCGSSFMLNSSSKSTSKQTTEMQRTA